MCRPAESTDPEFDDYQRKFTTMEETVEKLLKDCKKFNEAVVSTWSDYVSVPSILILSQIYSLLARTLRNISLRFSTL